MKRLTRLPLLMMLACTSILLLSCGGAGDGGGSTSSKGVEQIFSENCVNCHNNNSVGTFSLALDENGKQNAETYKEQIKTTVLDKTMPPWLVDGAGSCNTFSNDKSMSNGEINAIAAWADAGGLASSLGSAQSPPPLPKLDRVDATVQMAQNYSPAPNTEVSRCFLVDALSTGDTLEEKYISAYEVIPGNQKIVHHVVLYGINDSVAEDNAMSFDVADLNGPGYECFGSSGLAPDRSPILASWTPGTGAISFPAGTGLRLNSNFKLIMQVHYDTRAYSIGTTVDPDLTTINLKLVDKNIITPADIIIFEKSSFDSADPILALPRDTSYIVETSTADLKFAPWEVLGILPHMHNFGTSLRLEKITESGQASCLMDVPIWEFEWQQFFFYSKNRQATVIEETDQVKITCKYDTTDYMLDVANGYQADEEMCAAYFYVIPKI